MIRSHARSILGVAAVGAAALKFVATAAAAGMIWIHLCGSYTQGSGSTGGTLGVARSWTSNPGVTTPFGCPPNSAGTNPYGMEVFGGRSSVPAGARAHWEIDAPGGLVIVGVHTEGSGMVSYGVNQNMGWGGGFYWQGGGAQAYPAEVGYSSPPLFSSYFGWQIICGWSTCNGSTRPGEISILGLEIEAAEGSGPTVAVRPGEPGRSLGMGAGYLDDRVLGGRTKRGMSAVGESGWGERVAAAQRAAESGYVAPVPGRLVLAVCQHRHGRIGRGRAAGDVGPRRRL